MTCFQLMGTLKNMFDVIKIMISQDKTSSFPDVLVNRSVLCNCEIEAENCFLLESLAACPESLQNY